MKYSLLFIFLIYLFPFYNLNCQEMNLDTSLFFVKFKPSLVDDICVFFEVKNDVILLEHYKIMKGKGWFKTDTLKLSSNRNKIVYKGSLFNVSYNNKIFLFENQELMKIDTIGKKYWGKYCNIHPEFYLMSIFDKRNICRNYYYLTNIYKGNNIIFYDFADNIDITLSNELYKEKINNIIDSLQKLEN